MEEIEEYLNAQFSYYHKSLQTLLEIEKHIQLIVFRQTGIDSEVNIIESPSTNKMYCNISKIDEIKASYPEFFL